MRGPGRVATKLFWLPSVSVYVPVTCVAEIVTFPVILPSSTS